MTVLERLRFGFGRRTPVILQTEAAECALACLAMVANFHGHSLDLAAMRRAYATTLKGLTLRALMGLAGTLDLTARALRLEPASLGRLRLPCILHWNLNHFVVLVEVNETFVVIHDPAAGRRKLALAELAKQFTGVALELWPNASFKPVIERRQLKLTELLRSISGLGRAMSHVLLISIAIEAFALLIPIGTQLVVDQVIVAGDMSLLTVIALALGLLVALQAATRFVRSWAIMVMSTNLGVQLTSSLFDRLIRLPVDYFEKRHIGDVISRFSSLGEIQRTVSTQLVTSVVDGIMAIGLFAMMLVYGGWLAAIGLVTTALYVAARAITYAAYLQASEEEIVFNAKRDTHLMETVRGISSLKLFDLKERRRAGWLNHLVDATNASLKTEKLDVIFQTATSILFGADRILMLYLGAAAIIAGSSSVGMLLAFLAYKDDFARRIENLINSLVQFRMLSLHAERVSDIVLSEVEDEGDDRSPPLRRPEGRLEAKQLSFRYGASEPEIFKRLDLAVEPGESVAIVGPSGCGKTTLVKVLAGLMAPSSGDIAIDGVPLRALGLTNYRRLVGCVLQEDRLFAGSIADNICAFDLSPDGDRILACAQAAALHEDILRMPMGYETLVGDMGSTLSGGQKQRLFLARALYKEPAILFLDEATSHLDEANEAVVNNAIRRLRITRIIVAHRPSTIRSADRVIDLGHTGVVRPPTPVLTPAQ
ncbi:peptidase domain-containing ABC transporter [Chelatococcus reniformis]|uniref:Colicin V biosynthesis protein n=1 Tax=Chelatococcus reniformis TaxID=1494448 RepID=A0A916UY96_9HYPH|nr:peptidase domain-containing ABC transporter [Chelatococcus reniformis]GGC92652.1 colicin V biosynthesis protein [Chelatococcus reniformis]